MKFDDLKISEDVCLVPLYRINGKAQWTVPWLHSFLHKRILSKLRRFYHGKTRVYVAGVGSCASEQFLIQDYLGPIAPKRECFCARFEAALFEDL